MAVTVLGYDGWRKSFWLGRWDWGRLERSRSNSPLEEARTDSRSIGTSCRDIGTIQTRQA